jgi:uncharacterized protein YbaR (Trm112 family)
MSETDGYERVHPEQMLWVCPECGGVLDSFGDPELIQMRRDIDWTSNPAAVICHDCEQRYRIRFDPIG